MASFWLIKELFIVVLVCKLVVSFSVERKYTTKFQCEEQLLEKLIRLEIYFDNLKKDNSLSLSKALDTIKKTKQEMDSSNTNLDDALELINKTKQEMDKEITNLINSQSEIKNLMLETQTSMKAEYDGLTVQMNKLKTYISEIKNKGGTNVAFNVYSMTPQTSSGYRPVIFEGVNINEGNGYDVSTGIFTAPVSGIYQFNGNLCANKGGDLDYGIIVNGVFIVKGEFRAATDADDEKCTSFGAAYVVRKGEEVKVYGYNAPLDVHFYGRLSFSGALIKEV